LNALSSFEMKVFEMNIANWGIECLVATSLAIIYVLPDNSPVLKIEDWFSQNVIGLEKTIEDKSLELLANGD
jgi:hypothetical protein